MCLRLTCLPLSFRRYKLINSKSLKGCRGHCRIIIRHQLDQQLANMPSRQRYVSCSSSSLPTATMKFGFPEKWEVQQTNSNRPCYQYNPVFNIDRKAKYVSRCASVDSSLTDDMTDEEEIFVCLNPKAMAAIPRRLQNVMREIQAERYERLKVENPKLRVMPADYWIRPVRPVQRKPITYNRAPTPLYFALPEPGDKRNAFQGMINPASRVNPTIQSLGPGHHYRWVASPTTARYTSQAQRPVTAGYRSRNHSAHTLHSRVPPTNEFQVLNGYRQPMHPNMVFNQEHKQHRHRRSLGFRSLSVKPVASNLRDRLKRSFSRLNKWMRNEI